MHRLTLRTDTLKAVGIPFPVYYLTHPPTIKRPPPTRWDDQAEHTPNNLGSSRTAASCHAGTSRSDMSLIWSLFRGANKFFVPGPMDVLLADRCTFVRNALAAGNRPVPPQVASFLQTLVTSALPLLSGNPQLTDTVRAALASVGWDLVTNRPVHLPRRTRKHC
jgi:hypothetical protein